LTPDVGMSRVSAIKIWEVSGKNLVMEKWPKTVYR